MCGADAARLEATAHLDAWKTDGHELVGRHVARFFGASKGPKVTAYLAVLTRWLPAADRVALMSGTAKAFYKIA